MQHSKTLLAALIVASAAAAYPLVRPAALDDEGVGYEDTPVLPGSEWRVHDKHRPVPKVVTPGDQGGAPSDAVVLFDGSNLDAWTGKDDKAAWTIEDGAMVINGSGAIRTRQEFGDVQLHLEWASPAQIEGESQGRGNSGVFLMERYEVQILDSYGNRSYADGQAAAMYGQRPPDANVCRPPGEWQTYDILFRAPTFSGGELETAARITLLHNGVVVHDAEEYIGATTHKAVASYSEHAPKGPIQLQDHSNPVRFRNIWVREL